MNRRRIIAIIASLLGVVIVVLGLGAAVLLNRPLGLGSKTPKTSATNPANSANSTTVGNSANSTTNRTNTNSTTSGSLSLTQRIGQNLMHVDEPLNILLIANNARNASSPLSLGTAAGQADIILIAHVDPLAHKVTIISVPRDTLMAMPDYSITIPKIKSAFTIGLNQSANMGPELEMQMVSKLTGLPMKYWIVTDFQGFIDAVNAVGGIQVDVKQRIYDPAHSGANLQPGVQTLNGEQALGFVRVRQNAAGNAYRTNDFERQQAEIQVLQTLKQKLLDSTTNPLKLFHLAKLWNKDVATNLSTEQLVGIGMAAQGATLDKIVLGSDSDSMDLAGTPLPGANKQGYITGAYYDVLNPSAIYDELQPLGSSGSDTGLPDIPDPSQVSVTVYGSKDNYNQLKKAGYVVTYGGGSSSGRVNIYYPPGKIQLGWAVARTLGTGNSWVAPDPKLSSSVVVQG